jgi:hypothetical protein
VSVRRIVEGGAVAVECGMADKALSVKMLQCYNVIRRKR